MGLAHLGFRVKGLGCGIWGLVGAHGVSLRLGRGFQDLGLGFRALGCLGRRQPL